MAGPRVTVCMKWVPRRTVVDPLTATIESDPRSFGPSAADEAALELGLRLGDEVTVLCAGPPAADAMLRDALAAGAAHAVRCDLADGAGSAVVARGLAAQCRDTDLVLCGDYSLDRGSGAVPAFLAAELAAAQMLGLVALEVSDGVVIGERRLDRGRRSRLRSPFPVVVSVEGSTAHVRRASLPDVIRARNASIVIGAPVTIWSAPTPTVGPVRPYRPRTKVRRAPSNGPPHVRVLDITRATEQRNPPQKLHLDPGPAADAAIEAMRQWGYLPPV